jgi:hypothetical protein
MLQSYTSLPAWVGSKCYQVTKDSSFLLFKFLSLDGICILLNNICFFLNGKMLLCYIILLLKML